jgi:hypothetical protein
MAIWSKVFRLAALALLLSAVVDLIAVDTLGAFWQDKQTVQNELNGSCAQDDCFCCSGTAVPCTPVVLAPSLAITPSDEPLVALAPSLAPAPLFHPPRA